MNIIAIDLDGTLLSDNHSIHEDDLAAIKQVQTQGHLVTIATGRALFDAKHILKTHGIDLPIIASNGAQIYVDNQKVVERSFDSLVVLPLIEWLNEEEMYYQIYLPTTIIVSDQGMDVIDRQLRDVTTRDLSFNEGAFWEGIKAQQFQYGLEVMPEPISVKTDDSIIKVMVVSPDIERLNRVREYVSNLDGCIISSSGWFNLEIMTSGIDKGVALQTLCDHYGISERNAIAIGDNHNDIPMFLVAGIGIAMGNAAEALVKVASFQTLSNQENGVSHALQRLYGFRKSQPNQEIGVQR
ncbi:Cof-type HAD-IIB family hydrolase [Alkalihalobacillus macyae]|uniref:Cof-type HAD-IIB family hydrolase n=1 Tax=Guptibacillus hwajinpoensis TaxID=208199 RepID=UPI00273C6010|nr:Cof-type HAD-IIB family hydrolase [Alkalihalobacillus macyae]MDP4552810.1 Cof-type HAD-IIB family hydrolase [Alkalihalobacillus macyae]